ncbi:MAG: (d)CMP kinase [Planctomycetota bacterium]|nr:(d)CMP kinase [Planctomycetota bacterium]MDI6787064.1 (d)CMP kinase [Planctomycetota bacterium]
MKKPIIITIDGPAGAGKSTIAKLLADKLSFHYLDTGALYRAITLKTLRENILLSNEQAIIRLLSQSSIEIKYSPSSKSARILLDGDDVSNDVRAAKLTDYASQVSALGAVRREMVKLQRRLARAGDIVCEGRDMGSVVFPRAQIKFYLDASLENRSKRRYKENKSLFPNSRLSYKQILKEIKQRDYRDTHRKVAPLIKPTNAFYIDTTNLSIPEVLKKLIGIINNRLRSKK